MTHVRKTAVGLLAVFISSQGALWAQSAPPAPVGDAEPDKPLLTAPELEQLIAPIALYPDPVLTQVLMASTYPLEIVQADRWLGANKGLKADALATELEKQPWDASVKSLVNFPDVLDMMSEKLDLTIKLGDAFIAQQADVMNTVQKLRGQAQAAGNLKNNEQQNVIVEAAPAAVPADPQVVVVQAPPPQIIKIESPSPTVIYVPTYNPTVVYGAWPYPAYPPYPYYPPRPPGYVATAAISFGVGVACGAAWGYAWGNCNWGKSNVNIDVNRNTNFNTNINRNNTNINGGNGNWQHNPQHRQGVAYPNNKTAQQYGGANQSAKAAQARDSYRGRTDAGGAGQVGGAGAGQNRPNTGNVGGAAQNRPSTGGPTGGAQNRPSTGSPAGGAANRPSTGSPAGGAANRPSTGGPAGGAQNRPSTGNGSSSPRPSTTGTNSGALSGVNNGGGAARSDSQRGAASRSGGSRPAGGGGGGGGARSGGGGGGRR